MGRTWTQVPDDTVVLGKTGAGQRAATCAASSLEPLERRLPSAVNGDTPLRYLIDLVQRQASELSGVIAKLLPDAGLVVIAARGETPVNRSRLVDRRQTNEPMPWSRLLPTAVVRRAHLAVTLVASAPGRAHGHAARFPKEHPHVRRLWQRVV